MPIQWTISHPTRLVVAVCKGAITRQNIEAYLDAVVVADTLTYRKIFDMTQATANLPDDDMMALGARIRAYATVSDLGPLAIVATTPDSYERAHLFAALAEAMRPLKIFRELHLARRWLDTQAPSG
ncbi:hypothetical protein [Reyranella sp.]|uniref:hypothetical protein n=1 Tax=Reyranella sp. TaxID=1929291 RepID=UPI003D1250B6